MFGVIVDWNGIPSGWIAMLIKPAQLIVLLSWLSLCSTPMWGIIEAAEGGAPSVVQAGKIEPPCCGDGG